MDREVHRSVLKPGDVVYVAPVEKKTTKEEGDDQTETTEVVTGEWSLQQIPKVSGAIVVMDPHSGRVLAIAGGFASTKASSTARPRLYGSRAHRLSRSSI